MKAQQQPNNAAKPLWVTAQSKQNADGKQKLINGITKKEYFRVLEELKELYKPLQQLAFERDYEKHPSDKPNPMHCFLNNEVYWHLRCDDNYNFTIVYSVGELSFATAFNELILSVSKSVRRELTFEMEVAMMFKRCKRLQSNEFFYVLK